MLLLKASRSLLLVQALVLAGCGAQPASRTQAPDLAGAWRVKIQFQSGDFAAIRDLEFMTVFNPGGTMTESSNYDAAPPVPPAYGIWRAREQGFEARYEFFVTRPPAAFTDLQAGGGWLPAGRGVLTEEIQLAADGRSYTSHIRYAAYDSLGHERAGGGDGEGRGARIEF